MTTFILVRLWHGVIVVLSVTALVFLVTRVIGDPVLAMLPPEATAEQRALLRSQLGMDKPLAEQFVHFAGSVATLEFGDSIWQRRPAMDVVAERLPMTALLTAAGIGLAILLAIPLGVLAAMRPGSWLDRAVVTASMIGLSLPQFWLGLLLVILFGVTLGWLPTSGARDARYLILPALTLALPSLGRLLVVVRASMLEEMGRQYVKTARAKGLSRARVIGVHALRNASVPILTLSGWEIVGALAGNVVVVETVFAWPGLGLTVMQAIQRQDIILLQAVVFSVAIMAVSINLLLDILHKALDPRVSFR
ncbi:Dipeptide transport system permease protein DppB (TC 3.A.1.5.2) [plant metagenome]|uniref:Dipeptide transport system permease protein DppB (TC 3.A.1.5.2) n=1 Tax=plant metagenome TaxID=1297885 RepID=A0A484P4Q9_9ZZZZ